jgi:hypothetical protein
VEQNNLIPYKQMHGLGLPYVNILFTISVIKEKISREPRLYSVPKAKIVIRPIIISVIIIRVYKFNDVLFWA